MHVGIVFAVPCASWFLSCLLLEFLRVRRNRFFPQPKHPLDSESKLKAVITAGANMVLSSVGFFYAFPLLERYHLHEEKFSFGLEFCEFVFMLLLSDTMFYWSHRILHIPIVYRIVHKTHHEHTSPIAWSSFYVHPVELIVTWLFVFLVPALFVRVHEITFTLYVTFLILSLVKSHCGVKIGRYSAAHHDAHHESARGNYGSDLGLWDFLCGTKIVDPTSLNAEGKKEHARTQ